jgi:uncharacterized SAM-binding protein YcdF (DUF218 family)
VLLLLLGLILTRPGRSGKTGVRRSTRVGRFLLLLGLVLLYVLSLGPVANLLTYPLESRYPMPAPETLGQLDIVAVLGGGIYSSGSLRPEPELSVYSYPRFFRGVRIFQQTQAGLLAFCGGPSEGSTESEAETMKTLALSLGLPAEKILVETQSRDTYENIANLAHLLPADQGRRIGLVTSALHLWRSERVFAQQFPQDTVVPIPACYTYDPPDWSVQSFVPSPGSLEQTNMALHEWIGLLWYSLRHR